MDYQRLTKIVHAEHRDYFINKSSVANISATKMYNFVKLNCNRILKHQRCLLGCQNAFWQRKRGFYEEEFRFYRKQSIKDAACFSRSEKQGLLQKF